VAISRRGEQDEASEVERLRGLIRAVVTRGAYDPEWRCFWCNAKEQRVPAHDSDCPWAALVAEAEKS
jgi:hypothetical protein